MRSTMTRHVDIFWNDLPRRTRAIVARVELTDDQVTIIERQDFIGVVPTVVQDYGTMEMVSKDAEPVRWFHLMPMEFTGSFLSATEPHEVAVGDDCARVCRDGVLV
jgi:hypothetical protein